MKSFIEVSSDSDFPIQNIPFGIIQTADRTPRAATAIGNYVVDLLVLAAAGYFDDLSAPVQVFSMPSLNAFIALGKPVTQAVRCRIQELLSVGSPDEVLIREKALIPIEAAQLLMPIHIPNYTDFYSSREHATNVGMMFRDPANALLPNWLHLPVGYHGRASSIVVSGTPVVRPKGQTKADDQPAPTFGPSRLLDFELEMAFVVGKETNMGDSISTADAEDYIFGMLLFNDWSARDIQKWEYVPLGPFLAKNFASTVSPWIVTMEALAPFRTATPMQEPAVLPYLKFEGEKNFDIHLEVEIVAASGARKVVSESNFKYMYWNMAQQLAHHTVNGCNVEVGDLYASGTISGPTPDSYGSMLEISWQGKKPVVMPDGSERRFLQDGDTVVMRGYGLKDGIRIGFGECSGQILPAKQNL
ncbi:MAG: fumarylacetoacetase [Chitinophagales bacterium]